MQQRRGKHTQNNSPSLGQPSSFFQIPVPVRPPFLPTIHQNSPCTSSFTQFPSVQSQPPAYNPIFHQPASSFQSTLFEANLHESESSSQPTSSGPLLHQSSSTCLDHGEDLIDEYELKLLIWLKRRPTFLITNGNCIKAILEQPYQRNSHNMGRKLELSKFIFTPPGPLVMHEKRMNFFDGFLINLQKLKNKREACDVEFFDIAYQMKKGSYVTDSSREFMDRAREEISKKMGDIGSYESINHETQSEIERDVMRELMRPDKPGRARGYGA